MIYDPTVISTKCKLCPRCRPDAVPAHETLPTVVRLKAINLVYSERQPASVFDIAGIDLLLFYQALFSCSLT